VVDTHAGRTSGLQTEVKTEPAERFFQVLILKIQRLLKCALLGYSYSALDSDLFLASCSLFLWALEI